MRIGILIIALLCSLVAKGQNLEQDMKKMSSIYTTNKQLYIEMENAVYEDGHLLNKRTTALRKSAENYHYEMQEQQVLLNDKYIVFVDKRNYNLVVSERNKKQEATLKDRRLLIDEDRIKQYQDVLYKGEKAGLKHYQLTSKTEKIQQIDLFFEVKTGFIKKMTYYYNPNYVPKNTHTEILIKVINTQPNFSSVAFSEKQFVTIQNKKILPAERYKKYSVHDNRPMKK